MCKSRPGAPQSNSTFLDVRSSSWMSGNSRWGTDEDWAAEVGKEGSNPNPNPTPNPTPNPNPIPNPNPNPNPNST